PSFPGGVDARLSRRGSPSRRAALTAAHGRAGSRAAPPGRRDPHGQKELDARLRRSLQAGRRSTGSWAAARGQRLPGSSRTPHANGRGSDRRQQRPVGALLQAMLVRDDGCLPAGPAGSDSTVVSAACPACYAMVTLELPRSPKAPARLDAELVHTSGQPDAEIHALTVSGRPLLVQRVQAFRRESAS